MEHTVPAATTASARMASLWPVPVVTVAHVAGMGALAWAWLTMSGASRGWLEALLCAAPGLLALVLAFTSQADRNQYVIRLVACAAMLPILLMMWAGSQDGLADVSAVHPLARRPWIFFVGFAVLHAAVFVGSIVWLGGTVTRVEPAPGVMPVAAVLLAQRLRSLAASGLPLDLRPGDGPGDWTFHLRLRQADRAHRVLLHIDERRHTVSVRERLSASGAAPRDRDEASMRSIGDAAFDPARPDAQRVSSRETQASMIDPDRLQATRLVMRDGDVELAPQASTTNDADEIVTLMCALVTRSGYAWQPVLFGGGGA